MTTPQPLDDPYTKLWQQLISIGLHEIATKGGELFANKPDRWWDSPTWRCVNDHVSKRYLKTETVGDVCLAHRCRQTVLLTFPEDKEGPLVVPTVACPCGVTEEHGPHEEDLP